jgi:hypothetical protein
MSCKSDDDHPADGLALIAAALRAFAPPNRMEYIGEWRVWWWCTTWYLKGLPSINVLPGPLLLTDQRERSRPIPLSDIPTAG